jgi:hypothetical protein
MPLKPAQTLEENGREQRYTGQFLSPSGISNLCCTVARMVTPKGSMSTQGERLQVSVQPYRCLIYLPLVTYWAPDKRFSHTLNSLGQWPQCTGSNSVGISCATQNVLSIGGSVRYTVWNLHCTITTDSVLANSKTQNGFLFRAHAMFHHDGPLAVKPASMPWCLVHKKTWRDSLPIDMLLSAVSVLVVAQPSVEFPEGLMN